MPLLLPVAGAFVLLPNMLVEAFGPPLPRTQADLTGQVVLVHLLLPSLIALVAQLGIMRLTLDIVRGTSRSVAEALAVAARTWPFAVAAVFLTAVPIAAGMLVLIVPGLYMAGRLALALPLVLDGGAGPVDAVRRSWDATDGNGWRVIGFILMWAFWFIALSFLAAGVGAALGTVLTAAGAPAVGSFVVSLLGGAAAAIFSVFQSVGTALIYERLKGR